MGSHLYVVSVFPKLKESLVGTLVITQCYPGLTGPPWESPVGTVDTIYIHPRPWLLINSFDKLDDTQGHQEGEGRGNGRAIKEKIFFYD